MDAHFHFINVPGTLRAGQIHEYDFQIGPKAVISDYGGAQKPAVFKLKVLGLHAVLKNPEQYNHRLKIKMIPWKHSTKSFTLNSTITLGCQPRQIRLMIKL